MARIELRDLVPPEPQTKAQRSLYYLFIAWLGLIFVVTLYLGFATAKNRAKTTTGPSLKIAERLGVIATFSDGISAETKKKILDLAIELESVPEHKAILEGQAESLSDYEHLSPGYQLLGRFQTDKAGVREYETEIQLHAAVDRFVFSFGWLLTLGLSALLLLLAGKAKATPQASPPTNWRPWSILGLFWGWFVLNNWLIVNTIYKLTSSFGGLTFTLAAQLTGYAVLAAMLRKGVNHKDYQFFHKFTLGWIGRGYFLALATAWSINMLIANLVGKAPQSNNPLLEHFAKAATWQIALLAVLVIAVGPLFEELVFRSWLLGGLKEHWGPWPALLISAGLFAIVHFELQATPTLFGLGLVFGWVYLKTGSSWASTAVHAMWNATSVGFLIAGLP